MELTTPALLFPAISLLLLAYTNRFLVLGQLIRDLSTKITPENQERMLRQLEILGRRVRLIIWMQALGVFSFLCCAVTMFMLYLGWKHVAHGLFGFSLLCMVTSLLVSLAEIRISGHALAVQLENLHAGWRVPLSPPTRSRNDDEPHWF